ncbi:MAG: hypothetical protein ACRD2B_12890 [Terriglobia bacterium]
MSVTLCERKLIAVFPSSSWRSESVLLASLQELFPVDFVPESETSLDQADAALCFPGEDNRAKQAFERGVSSFLFGSAAPSGDTRSASSVWLSNHSCLHPAFRNDQVPGGGASAATGLAAADQDCILASQRSRPLWIVRSGGQAELHTTALGPPRLGQKELLWSWLQPENWMALVPLLHFLRRITAESGWRLPEQHACFIFDDPNLHSPRYGFIDFAELAEHAVAHDYSVAVATVPMDAGYAAPDAVQLFHKHQRHLSLLIHGNNHVRNELSRDYAGEEALQVLAQALTRTARLERITGLRVSRVVVAPHSACTESVMGQMLRLPLEGACISVPALLHWNPLTSWPLSFGLLPVSFMAGSFPVIDRFRFRNGLFRARLAALLGQPIIPYGHHQDCAEGLGPLAEIADAVNSWGRTNWTDLESILGAYYRTRRDGSLLHVEMWSRRVRVSIPPDVSHLAVHAAPGVECGGLVEVTADQNFAGAQACALEIPFRVAPSTMIEVRFASAGLIEPSGVAQPGYQLWPPVRRRLAIGRDRLMPVLGRFRRSTGDGFAVSAHLKTARQADVLSRKT